MRVCDFCNKFEQVVKYLIQKMHSKSAVEIERAVHICNERAAEAADTIRRRDESEAA